jgi:hypothetical protein
MLVRWETEPALVLSVAPLVREASARVNDLVILWESDVGTSLDVIHSNFGRLNSASSRRRGRQKSVSPSEEKLRLAWGFEWDPYEYPCMQIITDFRFFHKAGIPI